MDHAHDLESAARPSRRSVAAAAAWTVPAVAVAVGAPLAAASPTPTLAWTSTSGGSPTLGQHFDELHAKVTGTVPAGATALVTLSGSGSFSDIDYSVKTKVVPVNSDGTIDISGIVSTTAGGSVTVTVLPSFTTVPTSIQTTLTGGTAMPAPTASGNALSLNDAGNEVHQPGGPNPVAFTYGSGSLTDGRGDLLVLGQAANVGKTLRVEVNPNIPIRFLVNGAYQTWIMVTLVAANSAYAGYSMAGLPTYVVPDTMVPWTADANANTIRGVTLTSTSSWSQQVIRN